MSKDTHSNPFAALSLPITSQALKETTICVKSAEEKELIMQRNVWEIETIQKILLTTTASSSASNCCVVVKDVDEVSISTVGILLFERILFLDSFQGNPESIINSTTKNNNTLDIVTRTDPYVYLYESFTRCDNCRNKDNSNIVDKVQESICETYKTLLLQPDILTSTAPIKDLRTSYMEQILFVNPTFSMLISSVLSLLDEEEAQFPDIFKQVLEDASDRLNKSTIRNIDRPMINIFQFYASSKYLSNLLVNIPTGNGRLFQSSPLGSLLSISSIPRSDAEQYELSSDLSNHETASVTQIIIANLEWLRREIYELFLKLFKLNSASKDKLLRWIEQCLICNIGIASAWSLQQSTFRLANNFVSHGFIMNLCSVMLLLSQPFTTYNLSVDENKKFNVLKVDPMYCSSAAAEKKAQIMGYYGAQLSKTTTLIPTAEEDEQPNVADEFSFVTCCFFLTHRVLNLCVTIVEHELKNTSQQHRQLQQELLTAPPELRERLRAMIVKIGSKHIAIAIAFFDEKNAAHLVDICSSSCLWLSQITLFPDEDRKSLIPIAITQQVLREKEFEHNTLLSNIPEIIIENVVMSISLSKKSRKNIVASSANEIIEELFTFVVCFMGSPNRISNPHLRAQIAETLCSIMEETSGGAISSRVENSLRRYPLTSNLVSSLLHVFVSIEVTGSTVAFEEKFNYRRPMYDVIKMMWSLPNVKRVFVKFAKYALQHMESAQPPLFLRFVNLLINDAIFLLDEGLSYMVQLKQQVSQRENGDWERLGQEQLRSRTSNLNHMTLLAEFHNTLATYTIETIIKISEEISLLFVHSTLVDRIASMLNHFLQQLVGPKRKEFKVHDMEKYKFRPADIVANICTIYCNLYKHDSFAVAVIGDGRSYSSHLFSQAVTVLERTGNFALSTDIRKVEKVVGKAAVKHKLEEDVASSAPENFIDPIMIQVMNDPVLLPSSNVIVDRATIARHLLSDQSDPFNRQPLTMEDVIPCEELKEKIQKWRKQHSSPSDPY